ncbi:MAG: molybdopterin synthase sulfur carrier subunit [Alphaproteobacteria bacterium HGW-Alphaproteobacteria-13]|jgi:molybdopterin synthase sulfur carrier subunit|nr:MAG: molybdopterin synthase sulfur carrier subunit [Alphaproteobacteria bacterium HGW-Alphaproteobacteria-13]
MQISYFSWVRERMGIAEEHVALPPDVAELSALIAWLAARDARGAHAFAEPERIRAAIDGTMIGPDARIADAREIALFPPVTGG